MLLRPSSVAWPIRPNRTAKLIGNPNCDPPDVYVADQATQAGGAIGQPDADGAAVDPSSLSPAVRLSTCLTRGKVREAVASHFGNVAALRPDQ